jgi:hypothetical protein
MGVLMLRPVCSNLELIARPFGENGKSVMKQQARSLTF